MGPSAAQPNNLKKRPEAAPVSASLDHKLLAYAVAAGAIGAGALALPPGAEAKIVYTPAHETLGFGVTPLDLNHDGIPDFAFCNIAGGDGSTTACTLAVDRARRPRIGYHEPKTFFHFFDVIPPKAESQQNQIVGDSKFAYALQPGAHVGPKSKFTAGGRVMVSCATGFRSTSCGGRWFDVQHRYLGLKFIINGKIHFGWARLKVNAFARNAVLTGYAYETIPNKAILTGATKGPEDAEQPAPAALKTSAPEPATLSALALGTLGLAIWRRED
jgi:hypothetical protein